MTDSPLVREAHQLSSSIPISSIFIGKRRRRDYGNIDELAKDLAENGQITAITVRPPNEEDLSDPDYVGQPWVLVAGGRRLEAAKRAGWTTIRALDREALDPLKHRVLELAENLQRKEMDFVEVVQAKQEMFLLRKQQNPEITQAEVAREIGETPKTLSQDLRVAELLETRPELKKATGRKAVLRAGKMIEHLEARVARDIIQGTNKMDDLGARMVTAKAEDWLRSRAEGEFDLILSDPPYGIDYHKTGQKDGTETHLSEYDDSEGVSLDLYVDMVPQMIRVTKPTGWIILFQAEACYEFLKRCFESCCLTHYEYRDQHAVDNSCSYGSVEEPRWIWYRPNSQNNPRNPEQNAKNVYEHILVFNRGQAKLLRPCSNLIVCDAEYGNRIHAMQKPVELAIEIVSRVTLGGERVADPFYGSGNLLRGAARLARQIYGCDANPALRPLALANVSNDYEGSAPAVVRQSDLNETSEFLDTQFPELTDSDEAEMEEFAP